MSKYIENDIDGNEGGARPPSADEVAVMLGRYLAENTAGSARADGHGEPQETEIEHNLRRQQRLREMKRRKKQQETIRRLLIPGAAVLVFCVILGGLGIRSLVRKHTDRQRVQQNELADNSDPDNNNTVDGVPNETDLGLDSDNSSPRDKIAYDGRLNVAGCDPGNAAADCINEEISQIGILSVRTLGGRSDGPPMKAVADEATVLPDGEVKSLNSIFIDVDAGRIMGQRDAGARISPASMTKILTVLVAAEHITDPDDTFEITMDITDYSFVNGCSNAGFEVGEIVTVRDLFYGTVLPSGADAALGLAIYVAGSHEAFVELMNEKIDELGLSRTSHFTNCVGLYDENHYSTVYDMAVMLKAASDNSFCREVLSAHIYTTSATEQHPEGIALSNWFLRKIEDKDTHGEVLCAKTGFVEQSRNCAASLSVGNDGKEYICVTAHAESSWLCIYDHVALCQQFLPDKGQSAAGGS